MAEPSTNRPTRKVALVGNPNTGKSSIFNALTGLDQQVGNFPGVTVERKLGKLLLPGGGHIQLMDLPGTYGLEPRSVDERITTDVITDTTHADHPDLLVLVAEATQLRTCLYLIIKCIERKLPAILVLNKVDSGLNAAMPDTTKLAQLLGVDVILTDARTGTGITTLFEALEGHALTVPTPSMNLAATPAHQSIKEIMAAVLPGPLASPQNASKRIDDLMMHPVLGYVVFLAVILTMFNAVFSWAEWPMAQIEWAFGSLAYTLASILPPNFIARLVIDGLLAGLAGVVVFVPQIALLFLFISLMEETGYMARISFLMDRLLRSFGLNGRSVVPLFGGAACAVPAIMSARTIPDARERLLTILVTPLISCSARLPVYTLLIALVVPTGSVLGVGYKGLVMVGLFALGTLSALLSALVLRPLISAPKDPSAFIMQLPDYRMPDWRNVGLSIWSKMRSFVTDAGKWIVGISMVLWLGSTLSLPGTEQRIEQEVSTLVNQGHLSSTEAAGHYRALELEYSFVGMLGKAIEPVFAPMGYDWRICVAIVTSFAAREVFVGTMATIFSLQNGDDRANIRQQMAAERLPDGSPRYDLAFGLSLMVFYAFAMQCMSTLAITRSETGTWKWPLVQFVYMSALAYVSALGTHWVITLIFG